MPNARFATALHALALLADSPQGASSEWISGSVNGNPAALRRVLQKLASAKLVEASVGRGGGYRLKRPAEKITLDEIYRAVEEEPLLAPAPMEPSPQCPIGSGMQKTFAGVAEEAERAMLRELAGHTVAWLAKRAQAEGKKSRR